MKDFALRLLLLCWAFLGPALAYGPRSAAEQMSFWYVYLLEGEAEHSGMTYRPMVAVTCAQKMKPDSIIDRCSLSEFVKFLWAEQKGKKGPINTPWGDPDFSWNDDAKWASADLSKVFANINQSGFTHGVRGNRLVRGENEYWTARQKVTQPIARLETRVNEFRDPELAQKLVDKAKEANRMAYMMRVMDYEKYRIKKGSLDNILGDDKKVETKQVSTGINGYNFKTLDAEATLEKYPDLTQGDLASACEQVRNLPHNKDHWVAIQAAQHALANGNCVVPDEVMLK